MTGNDLGPCFWQRWCSRNHSAAVATTQPPGVTRAPQKVPSEKRSCEEQAEAHAGGRVRAEQLGFSAQATGAGPGWEELASAGLIRGLTKS